MGKRETVVGVNKIAFDDDYDILQYTPSSLRSVERRRYCTPPYSEPLECTLSIR